MTCHFLCPVELFVNIVKRNESKHGTLKNTRPIYLILHLHRSAQRLKRVNRVYELRYVKHLKNDILGL